VAWLLARIAHRGLFYYPDYQKNTHLVIWVTKNRPARNPGLGRKTTERGNPAPPFTACWPRQHLTWQGSACQVSICLLFQEAMSVIVTTRNATYEFPTHQCPVDHSVDG